MVTDMYIYYNRNKKKKKDKMLIVRTRKKNFSIEPGNVNNKKYKYVCVG